MDLDLCENTIRSRRCKLIYFENFICDLFKFNLKINWESRMDLSVAGQTCFTSLDGVDFKILEPSPFSPVWFSHKFRSAGLRYELALNVRTGFMVWVNGGYPCGMYSDLRLAREAFVLFLNDGERSLADKVYKDHKYFILPNTYNTKQHNLIMARHEIQILKQEFRNAIHKHPMVVHAVANITQVMLMNGHPLFSVI